MALQRETLKKIQYLSRWDCSAVRLCKSDFQLQLFWDARWRLFPFADQDTIRIHPLLRSQLDNAWEERADVLEVWGLMDSCCQKD